MWILQQLSKSPAMESFSHDEISELQNIFALMDRSGCGKISTEEMEQLLNLQKCYPNEAELREIVAKMDCDRDGEISFEDFVAYYLKREADSFLAAEKDREVKDAFDFLDHNGDGYVTAADLRNVMRLIGHDVSEEQAEQMLGEVDKEGNGMISYKCFKNIMLEDTF